MDGDENEIPELDEAEFIANRDFGVEPRLTQARGVNVDQQYLKSADTPAERTAQNSAETPAECTAKDTHQLVTSGSRHGYVEKKKSFTCEERPSEHVPLQRQSSPVYIDPKNETRLVAKEETQYGTPSSSSSDDDNSSAQVPQYTKTPRKGAHQEAMALNQSANDWKRNQRRLPSTEKLVKSYYDRDGKALWPHTKPTIKDCADAGLKFIVKKGYKDLVKCTMCKGTLLDFKPGDDPAEEHDRLYRECKARKKPTHFYN